MIVLIKKNIFEMKKILIVDDSEINRSLLSDMLSDEYEILEAENGMEASATAIQTLLNILRKCVRRHCDNRKLRIRTVKGTQRFRRFISVHNRFQKRSLKRRG